MKNNNYKNILDYFISMPSMKTTAFNAFIKHHKITEMLDEQSLFFYNLQDNKFDNIQKIKDPSWMKNERNRLINKVNNDTGLINVTAPTSFGKSHIVIKSILESSRSEKSIIISPTLALCSEYYMNIKFHQEKYTIINNNHYVTTSPLDAEATIFILTPEKALLLLKFNDKVKFKFAIFDEFYEAFIGERYSIFDSVFMKIKKLSEKQIIITPANVDFPDEYTSKNSFETKTTLTIRKFTKYIYDQKNNKTYKYKSSDFDETNQNGFLVKEMPNEIDINEKIKEYISRETSESIILLTRKKDMIGIGNKLLESQNKYQMKKDKKVVPIIVEYLKENFPNAILVEMIQHGIAYHNGSTDKFARTLIESAFKKGELKILIANTTITKGVNLNPDILIINNYNFMPGSKENKLKKIETINAVGRTGRTIGYKSLIGKVIIFANKSGKYEKFENIAKPLNREKIILEKFEAKKVDIINSYKKAYLNNLVQKIDITLTSEDVEILKKYLGLKSYEKSDSRITVCENIFKLVNKIFKIDFKGKALYAKWKLIKAYLLKFGYSKYYWEKREYIIENKYGINPAGKTNKNIDDKYELFKSNTIHEDYLIMGCYDDYETEAGFYFKHLLSEIIESAINEKFIDKESYKEYIKRIDKEELDNSEKGYPNSFANVKIKDRDNFLKRALDAIK